RVQSAFADKRHASAIDHSFADQQVRVHLAARVKRGPAMNCRPAAAHDAAFVELRGTELDCRSSRALGFCVVDVFFRGVHRLFDPRARVAAELVHLRMRLLSQILEVRDGRSRIDLVRVVGILDLLDFVLHLLAELLDGPLAFTASEEPGEKSDDAADQRTDPKCECASNSRDAGSPEASKNAGERKRQTEASQGPTGSTESCSAKRPGASSEPEQTKASQGRKRT